MQNQEMSLGRRLLLRGFSLVIAAALTVAVFLVLPVMQSIGNPLDDDTIVRTLDTAALAPPPPPDEIIEEEEEEPPEPPPQLEEPEPAPLDLSQIELALNPTVGEGAFGDFAIDIGQTLSAANEGEVFDQIFSLDELDQQPRAISQRAPQYPRELRKSRRAGTVYVVFMVDTAGRVKNAKVQKSSDPVFDAYALDAVKQWKFEPGTREGKKVQFKMRIPITFNKS